ncbi:MAG: TlpA family protein disulfide reductase, partial [Bacteroidetes bacterium]|nr:TlpA family protein disulfide reductase [Bacteroidota bacterium]
FKKYLTSTATKVTPSDLELCINLNKNYTALLDSLGKDSILLNEVLRETVLAKGLGELYKLNSFDKKNIIFMLSEISKKTKFPEISIIASNLVYNLTKLEPGTIAPSFSLPDINNLKYSLSDFKGKYVYLNFFTTNNLPCISEFQLMNQLKIDFGKDIEIISISVDKEILKLDYYLEKKSFNWLFLHFNNDYDLLEKYEAKSYPLFVLIDREGKILLNQAPMPSENVKKYFEELTAPVVKEIKRQY